MNFEERKAEIFRRSGIRIARRKKNRRILAAVATPVLLSAILAAPLLDSLPQANESIVENMEAFPVYTATDTVPESMTNESTVQRYPEPSAGTHPPEENADSPPSPTIFGIFIQEQPIDTPPTAVLITGEGICVKAVRGGYYWEYEYLGKTVCTLADSLHPLDPQGIVAKAETGVQTLTLNASALPPVRAEAQCWPISELGNYSAQATKISIEQISSADNTTEDSLYAIELLPGTHLYELTLFWHCGSARYTFQITYEE